MAPNDRYMQWARIWRKQVSLGEWWSIGGEKKFNHDEDNNKDQRQQQVMRDSASEILSKRNKQKKCVLKLIK